MGRQVEGNRRLGVAEFNLGCELPGLQRQALKGAVWRGEWECRELGVCGVTGCVITVSQGNSVSTNGPGLSVAKLRTLHLTSGNSKLLQG